jgi:hypothetical protein
VLSVCWLLFLVHNLLYSHHHGSLISILYPFLPEVRLILLREKSRPCRRHSPSDYNMIRPLMSVVSFVQIWSQQSTVLWWWWTFAQFKFSKGSSCLFDLFVHGCPWFASYTVFAFVSPRGSFSNLFVEANQCPGFSDGGTTRIHDILPTSTMYSISTGQHQLCFQASENVAIPSGMCLFMMDEMLVSLLR